MNKCIKLFKFDYTIECGHVEMTGDGEYLWETMYDERFYVIYNGEYLIEE